MFTRELHGVTCPAKVGWLQTSAPPLPPHPPTTTPLHSTPAQPSPASPPSIPRLQSSRHPLSVCAKYLRRIPGSVRRFTEGLQIASSRAACVAESKFGWRVLHFLKGSCSSQQVPGSKADSTATTSQAPQKHTPASAESCFLELQTYFVWCPVVMIDMPLGSSESVDEKHVLLQSMMGVSSNLKGQFELSMHYLFSLFQHFS